MAVGSFKLGVRLEASVAREFKRIPSAEYEILYSDLLDKATRLERYNELPNRCRRGLFVLPIACEVLPDNISVEGRAGGWSCKPGSIILECR